jgi:hypothetical protein
MIWRPVLTAAMMAGLFVWWAVHLLGKAGL